MVIRMTDGFTLHPADGSYLGRACRGGVYEREQSDIIRATVGPGWTFIDVGAGIGYYSMLAATWGCDVIAFEPSYENHRAVERAIIANNLFDRVTLLRLAVSDKAGGTVQLASNPNNDGDNRLVAPDEWVRQPVYRTTLDAALPGLTTTPQRVFIKADVQGGEMAVLRGAAGLIRCCWPTMLIEDAPHHCKNAGETGTLRDLLDAIGYRWCEVGKRSTFCDLFCEPGRA